MVIMVNSVIEATMSAIILARGYTKKNKIIKFLGCYHGYFDVFLIEAGLGVVTNRIPGYFGVSEDSINMPPSQYEALFLSFVHTEEHINKFLEAFRNFNI